jgi:anti-sigma B factor antagonist
MLRMSDDKLVVESLPGPAQGQRILKLSGPLVLSNFFDFQRALREDTSTMLILDFNNVPYIDSAAIGALMMAYVHRNKANLALLLVGVTPRVRTALKVTKVEQFFQFADAIPTADAAQA